MQRFERVLDILLLLHIEVQQYYVNILNKVFQINKSYGQQFYPFEVVFQPSNKIILKDF